MFDVMFLTLGSRRFLKAILIGSVVDVVIGLVLLSDRVCELMFAALPEITGTHVGGQILIGP